MKEYFIVRELDPNNWEVHRYSPDLYLLDTVRVGRDGNSFFSEDPGFKSHLNQNANKRIRVVKDFLSEGFGVFWIENGHIDRYKFCPITT